MDRTGQKLVLGALRSKKWAKMDRTDPQCFIKRKFKKRIYTRNGETTPLRVFLGGISNRACFQDTKKKGYPEITANTILF